MLAETNQAVLNDSSIIQESNRNPNVYAYINKGGKLYTPGGSLISRYIRRETFVERLEGRAYDEMEVRSKKAATLVWVSPAEFGVYEVSKIIVTEVIEQYGYSVLLNRAMVLDGVDSKKALQIAQELAKGAVNNPKLRTVGDVRANLIVLNPRQRHWLNVLEELAPDPQWQMIRSGQDMELEEQALADARLVYESKARGEENGPTLNNYRGEYSLSCDSAVSPFEAVWGSSEGSEGCKKIACRKCSWVAKEDEVRRIQARLLTSCPNCGWSP